MGQDVVAYQPPAVEGKPAPDVPELPLMLQRPSQKGAEARLTWSPANPDAKDPLSVVPRWRLAGSPAAIELAKKLFSGAAEGKGKISFPAAAAHFEDLLMLQHRHPIEIGTSARDAWEEFYNELIDSWLIRNRLVDEHEIIGGTLFKGQLREYQQEGIRFMLASRQSIVADDTGLGKTIEALGFISHVDQWPVAIICQPHVIPHWRRKIPEFLDVEEAPGTGDKPTWFQLSGTRPRSDVPKADIYLLHYLVADAWALWLRARNIKVVQFDEVQELRHTGTKKHDACKMISRSAAFVHGHSATPFYNRGPEMYNVMNTVNPGSLGTKQGFTDYWCGYDVSGKLVVLEPESFGQYLRDRKLMIRRTKDEVGRQLPPKRRVVEPISADNELFANLIKEAQRLAREALFKKDAFDRNRMEAEAINQTRLATGVAKLPATIAFLRGLMEAEEPTLCFAHHHAVYDAILDELSGFNPVAITGRETINQKDRSQKAFEAGESNLCLISLRASTGLDGLQKRARVVTFAELDWSPLIHRQAEDRGHRDGLRHSILCYYLVTDVGSDPHMLATLQVKESQFAGIMHETELSDREVKAAQRAAEKHKATILRMLRGQQ